MNKDTRGYVHAFMNSVEGLVPPVQMSLKYLFRGAENDKNVLSLLFVTDNSPS